MDAFVAMVRHIRIAAVLWAEPLKGLARRQVSTPSSLSRDPATASPSSSAASSSSWQSRGMGAAEQGRRHPRRCEVCRSLVLHRRRRDTSTSVVVSLAVARSSDRVAVIILIIEAVAGSWTGRGRLHGCLRRQAASHSDRGHARLHGCQRRRHPQQQHHHPHGRHAVLELRRSAGMP